jgi:hypothetical protein
MQKYFIKKADNLSPGSPANKMRNKRFILFRKLAQEFDYPIILDVGGTESYWENRGDFNNYKTVIILNKFPIRTTQSNFCSVVADANDLSIIKDKSIDVVHSNSVIEHLDNFEAQKKMANEIIRIGKRYFIQTPSFYFLLEPHFLFPFFQFLPNLIKIFLVRHFSLGWYKRIASLQEARQVVNKIRLLKEKELRLLFPDAVIKKERFLGLTKSFIVIK